MNLESLLTTAVGTIAKQLVRRLIDGKPVVGVPLNELIRKAEWQKIERAALREAARRRVEG